MYVCKCAHSRPHLITLLLSVKQNATPQRRDVLKIHSIREFRDYEKIRFHKTRYVCFFSRWFHEFFRGQMIVKKIGDLDDEKSM